MLLGVDIIIRKVDGETIDIKPKKASEARYLTRILHHLRICEAPTVPTNRLHCTDQWLWLKGAPIPIHLQGSYNEGASNSLQ